jgi:hypothetical protein
MSNTAAHALREIHVLHHPEADNYDKCAECGKPYPCPTGKIVVFYVLGAVGGGLS